MKRVVLVAALLAPAAGCIPNATWLPDSSGFVYNAGPAGKENQLRLYDVNKKRSRVLVEKGAGPCRPAVSPDGRRIAVIAPKKRKDGGTALEAVVFDLDGKELRRSGELGRPVPWVLMPQAFWSPHQEKLLLCLDAQAYLYELKTSELLELDLHVTPFGDSPVRPDGKGFLAARPSDGRFLFVDWDGKETDIEEKPKAFQAAARGASAADRTLRDLISYPFLESSRWEGSTAVAGWDDVDIRIDTENRTATLEKIRPTRTAAGQVVQNQIRLAGGVVVRVVETTPRYGESNDPVPSRGLCRLEALKPTEKEPRRLLNGVMVLNVLPSPDRTMVVVVGSEKADEENAKGKYYLINAKGELAAAIDMDE